MAKGLHEKQSQRPNSYSANVMQIWKSVLDSIIFQMKGVLQKIKANKGLDSRQHIRWISIENVQFCVRCLLEKMRRLTRQEESKTTANQTALRSPFQFTKQVLIIGELWRKNKQRQGVTTSLGPLPCDTKNPRDTLNGTDVRGSCTGWTGIPDRPSRLSATFWRKDTPYNHNQPN